MSFNIFKRKEQTIDEKANDSKGLCQSIKDKLFGDETNSYAAMYAIGISPIIVVAPVEYSRKLINKYDKETKK